jgi:class 3 adenylate cyclase
VHTGRLTAQEIERTFVRSALVGYLNDTDLHRLLKEPQAAPTLAGARRRVSVLSVVVRGAEGQLERLPPEEVVQGLRRALQALTGEVLRHKGRVEDLRGNGLLAVFGDPLPLPDHARRALEAGKALQQVLDTQAASSGTPLRLDVHAGVVTGEAVVGNVGLEGGRLEYVVLGGIVERAQHLAWQAPRGGVLSEP